MTEARLIEVVWVRSTTKGLEERSAFVNPAAVLWIGPHHQEPGWSNVTIASGETFTIVGEPREVARRLGRSVEIIPDA